MQSSAAWPGAALSMRHQTQLAQAQLPRLLRQCADLCWAGGDGILARRGGAALRHASRPHHNRPSSTAAAAARLPAGQPQTDSRRQQPTRAEQPADLQPGQLLELDCDSLAFGGQGVCRLAEGEQAPELAHLRNFVVLARGAIPGERLLARIHKVQKGHATAGKVSTLRTSPDAAQPPCPHFGPCGGCQHQNLQYAAQLAAKQSQASAALQRIAGVADIGAHTRPIVGAVQQYHYRNKLEFTFSGQSWVPADDGFRGSSVPVPAMGFVRPGHPDQVLPIDACWLQDSAANEILDAVKSGIAEAQLQPPAGGRKQAQAGTLQRVAIRQGSCPDTGAPQHMVHFTTGPAPDAAAALAPVVAAVRQRCPSVVSIVRMAAAAPRRQCGRAPAAGGDSQTEVLWGRPSISQELGGLIFDISARSFFQTNTAQAVQLTRMVVAAAAAGVRSSDNVMDLFCGAGFFALALASQCASVHGYEVSSAAVADARANAACNGIPNAAFQQANLDKGMPDATGRPGLPAPDVVITDPGRQGMSRPLLVWLVSCGARRIVYVSCNPATQARDLAYLLGTASDAPQPTQYQLDFVQACDMFPQTSHVESMAVLSRMRAEGS